MKDSEQKGEGDSPPPAYNPDAGLSLREPPVYFHTPSAPGQPVYGQPVRQGEAIPFLQQQIPQGQIVQQGQPPALPQQHLTGYNSTLRTPEWVKTGVRCTLFVGYLASLSWCLDEYVKSQDGGHAMGLAPVYNTLGEHWTYFIASLPAWGATIISGGLFGFGAKVTNEERTSPQAPQSPPTHHFPEERVVSYVAREVAGAFNKCRGGQCP